MCSSFYIDNVKLLQDVQKNLNNGMPEVLLYRIKDNNLSSIIPRVTTSDFEKYEKYISTSMHESFNEIQFGAANDDPCHTRNFENNEYFNISIKEQYDKDQGVSSFDNPHIEFNITPATSSPITYSSKYADDSFLSQGPIINDVLLNTHVNTNFDVNVKCQLPVVLSESNKKNNNSYDLSQNDNNVSQLKKFNIISDVLLDRPVSFDIVKNKTFFNIRRKNKSKDLAYNDNYLLSPYEDNVYSKLDTETLLNKSFMQDILDKPNCTDINTTDISRSDPTYEPSQLSITTETSFVKESSGMLLNSNNNISSNKHDEDDNILPQNKSNFSHVIESSNVQPGSCNDVGMFVAYSLGRSGANKKNFCLYCKTFQSKICRHLERIHKDEADVQKFINLPKGNKERKRIIDTIRRNGNFSFNTESKYNDGELIVCRRPNIKMLRNAQDFQACINCKGFFSKNTLRHHFRYCSNPSMKRNRSIMVLGRSITARIHKAANPILTKVVFPVLREDDITRLVRYDELLIKYANKLCDKYKLQHQHDMIRSRLRLLGRFLAALKVINHDIDNFTSLYHPKYYDDIIHAVNEVAGFDKKSNLYKTPSNATNLGTLLKQVGNTLITECIKNSDCVRKQTTEDLLKLIVEDYSSSVARTALETQSQQKRKKKVILPTTEDISKLYNYLKEIRRSSYEKLKTTFSYDDWFTLAKATLVAVLVFNRRRAGETERILIEEFNNRQSISEKSNYELFKSLSPNNKKIAKKYIRFVIRGKKNRDVPVLIDFDLTQCILLLLEHRRNAKVHPNNPYLFGLPGKNINRFKFLRACILLREFSHQCGAKLPDSLRGTKLRKHIATKCILLNLQGDEVADLANYMGHAENIHKEYYRQPIVSRDILRMSQLLEKAQNDVNANGNDSESDSEIDSKVEENESSDKENISYNLESHNLNKSSSYTKNSHSSYTETCESTNKTYESIDSTTVKRKRSSRLI